MASSFFRVHLSWIQRTCDFFGIRARGASDPLPRTKPLGVARCGNQRSLNATIGLLTESLGNQLSCNESAAITKEVLSLL
jgi:hypothetical protein